jgi:hypothetical protein
MSTRCYGHRCHGTDRWRDTRVRKGASRWNTLERLWLRFFQTELATGTATYSIADTGRTPRLS